MSGVHYHVNGYATEPLRLLEADMPCAAARKSRFVRAPAVRASPLVKVRDETGPRITTPGYANFTRGHYIDYAC